MKMRLPRDEFLPPSWREFFQALPAVVFMAGLFCAPMLARLYGPELLALRDEVQAWFQTQALPTLWAMIP